MSHEEARVYSAEPLFYIGGRRNCSTSLRMEAARAAPHSLERRATNGD